MSFFGFDPAVPKHGRHQQSAPGFAAPQDAFANASFEAAADEPYVFFSLTFDSIAKSK